MVIVRWLVHDRRRALALCSTSGPSGEPPTHGYFTGRKVFPPEPAISDCQGASLSWRLRRIVAGDAPGGGVNPTCSSRGIYAANSLTSMVGSPLREACRRPTLSSPPRFTSPPGYRPVSSASPTSSKRANISTAASIPPGKTLTVPARERPSLPAGSPPGASNSRISRRRPPSMPRST